MNLRISWLPLHAALRGFVVWLPDTPQDTDAATTQARSPPTLR